MECKFSSVSLSLLRCPSVISTTDGGYTPFTDLSSPGMRSPIPSTPTVVEDGWLKPVPRNMVATTNMMTISVAEGYRTDEYLVCGNIDLVACMFGCIGNELGSVRILMEPHGDSTTILCMTNHPIPGGIAVPLTVDGVILQFVKTHTRGCVCVICLKGFSQVLERPAKIGKYENLSGGLVPTAVSCPVIALPAHKLKLTGETGSLSVACDSLVKWIPWGKESVAGLLRTATVQGKTRAEVNESLSQSWIYTIYNGKPYKIKKVWFDMTPLSCFFDKKKGEMVSYASWIEKRYARTPVCLSSPMIEVQAEKRSETCFLVPEYCFILRPSQSCVPMHTVHAQTRTMDRRLCIEEIKQAHVTVKPQFADVINLAPIEAEGTILAPAVNLCITPLRRRPLPRHFRWALILIGVSEVSPTWLIYEVFEGCAPVAVLSCGSHQGAAATIRRVVAQARPDIIIVVLKNKAGSVYSTVKYVSLVECGVPCQVIHADTFHRQSPRIDLINQIRAKLGIGSVAGPQCLVALDFHRFGDLSIFAVAFKRSDTVELKYILDNSNAPLSEEDMADRYMMLLKQTLLDLPGEPIVVLACRRGVPKTIPLAERMGEVFNRFSLLVASVKNEIRLFSATDSGKNVPPGFCVDLKEGGFYLVPHRVEHGNSLAVLFLLAAQHVNDEVLKNVVWSSYGSDQTRRLPDLFRHTMKISELIGIHLRKIAGKDVRNCLEMSSGWKKLFETKSRYFYL
jgi:hypothetical protein